MSARANVGDVTAAEPCRFAEQEWEGPFIGEIRCLTHESWDCKGRVNSEAPR